VRLALAGGVAILLLAAASVLGVWWATRPSLAPAPTISARQVRPEAPPAVVAEEEASPAAPAPPPAPATPEVVGPRITPAEVRRAPPAAVPPGTTWDRIPPIPIRRMPAISAALEAAARPRLARCFDPEEQARLGRRPYTSIGKPRSGPGGAVLLLELEASPDGSLRVVDAPVEARGAAEDGLLACAQEALRGLDLGRAKGVAARLRVPAAADDGGRVRIRRAGGAGRERDRGLAPPHVRERAQPQAATPARPSTGHACRFAAGRSHR
jgi:hypothetical protein